MAGVFELPHVLRQPSSLQMPTWQVTLKSLTSLTRLVVVYALLLFCKIPIKFSGVMLVGSMNQMADEAERSIHDALCPFADNEGGEDHPGSHALRVRFESAWFCSFFLFKKSSNDDIL